MRKFSVTFNLERTFQRGSNISANEVRKLLNSSQKKKNLPFNPLPTAVYVWVTIMSERIKVRTGLYIKPEYWDNVDKRATKYFSGHIEFNNRLRKVEEEIYTEIFKRQNNKDRYTIEDLKSIIGKAVSEDLSLSRSSDFWDAFEVFKDQKLMEVKKGTMKKIKATETVFKKFEEEEKFELHFCKIDRKFDVKYRNWRLNTNGATNNTLSKDYDTLRGFMAWAKEEDYHDNTYFERLNEKRYVPTKPAFELNELQAIINLDLLDNKRLDRVRDTFCFQCLTGQRVSDIKGLKLKDLSLNDQGDFEFWILSQVKGRSTKTLQIPILPEANKILKKYKSIISNPNENLLPIISDQKYNDYIKEVARLAGISSPWKVIRYSGATEKIEEGPKYEFASSHMARRTFITLSILFGMPYEAILKVTGQSKVETLRGYASLAKEYQKKSLFEKWGDKI